MIDSADDRCLLLFLTIAAVESNGVGLSADLLLLYLLLVVCLVWMLLLSILFVLCAFQCICKPTKRGGVLVYFCIDLQHT